MCLILRVVVTLGSPGTSAIEARAGNRPGVAQIHTRNLFDCKLASEHLHGLLTLLLRLLRCYCPAGGTPGHCRLNMSASLLCKATASVQQAPFDKIISCLNLCLLGFHVGKSALAVVVLQSRMETTWPNLSARTRCSAACSLLSGPRGFDAQEIAHTNDLRVRNSQCRRVREPSPAMLPASNRPVRLHASCARRL